MAGKSNLTGRPVDEVVFLLNQNNGHIRKSATALQVAENTLRRYIRTNRLRRVSKVVFEAQS